MKRSEIINIITEAVDDCLDIPNDSFISKKNYGEYILNKIEKAGMLPEKYNKCFGEAGYGLVNQWEPENET